MQLEAWPEERGELLRILLVRIAAGELTAEELLTVFGQPVYRQTGTYDGAARRLGLDRRTVRAKVLRSLE
ncbi:hypothetical protein [Candidatus Laterigemmans baculatus]|uniref:hypothetical protein n=1 Tax=Candidatus Laterigemmans baculatus TaxID=2770505 RepID=UPI0013D94815|nr:hypothetical protein [Candidatus Laterigemmans baculatus]